MQVVRRTVWPGEKWGGAICQRCPEYDEYDVVRDGCGQRRQRCLFQTLSRRTVNTLAAEKKTKNAITLNRCCCNLTLLILSSPSRSPALPSLRNTLAIYQLLTHPPHQTWINATPRHIHATVEIGLAVNASRNSCCGLSVELCIGGSHKRAALGRKSAVKARSVACTAAADVYCANGSPSSLPLAIVRRD